MGGRWYPDEEVDHEEDVEGQVDLLCGAVGPLLARLHLLAYDVNVLLLCCCCGCYCVALFFSCCCRCFSFVVVINFFLVAFYCFVVLYLFFVVASFLFPLLFFFVLQNDACTHVVSTK